MGVGSFTDQEGENWRPLVLGVTAGRRYWQDKRSPRWTGWHRAQLNYLWGPNAEGTEIRVGSLFGPKLGVFTLQAGPELFYDEYNFDEGEVVLAAATGIAAPIILSADLLILRAYYGLEPRWFLDSSRQTVDWSAHASDGFGNEFAEVYGVHINLILLQLDLGQTRRYTAYGTHSSWFVGIRFLDI